MRANVAFWMETVTFALPWPAQRTPCEFIVEDGVVGAAPEPVTNRDFSKALGRALHRPAVAPVPAFALRLLYGEMAEIVTEGQRAVPERALADGFAFAHPDLDEALAYARTADA